MGADSWRIIAQRITTGQFLAWDVPLGNAVTSRTLSGPGGINGTIGRELARLTADDGRPLLEEWTTALYVEEDGLIRNGALVNSISNQGPRKVIGSIGFCGYPQGLAYTDDYMPADFEDPVDTFKNVWSKIQSYPDGDLGLAIHGPATYLRLSDGSGPFNIWSYDYRDTGQELDAIAKAAPFDFLESHTWTDSTHTAIRHDVTIGFPRLGRRRTDLRFADSENIVKVDAVGADGTKYANDVRVLGRGQGRGMVTARAAVRDGRLRRAAAVPHKDATQGLADRYAQQELRARRLEPDIKSIEIQDHPNARLSAITPGDDVLVECELEQAGDVRVWLRVLSVQESADTPGRATLKTQRSDSFTYAAPSLPNGDTLLVHV